MYVTINQTDYTALRNLSFAPETDVTGNAVPINEFSVEIITDDNISYGQYAWLYDDRDNLWAKYWIIYAERISADAVAIRAQSDVALLEGVILPEVMYDGEPVSDVLDDTMVRNAGSGLVATIDYTLDDSFNEATITGYCPEQSARERLQWVCFAIGAYVKTFFNEETEILPIDSTTTIVPPDKTYFKPTVNHSDYITAIKVTAYSFEQSASAASDDSSYIFPLPWVATEQVFTVSNSSVPSGTQDNEIVIDGLYLVNPDNVSAILTYLSGLYFKRTEVQLDVINNAEYEPGERLTVYADMGTMFSGYAKSCAFEFGKQAKARMVLTAAEAVTAAKLVLTYQCGDVNIGRAEYTLPVGYEYSITNPYIDMTIDEHRFIFRPTTATTTGTMASGGAEVTVAYAIALHEFGGELDVISVDEVTVNTSNVAVIS